MRLVFLALDLGTSSIKAMLLDTHGRVVALTSEGYRVDAPHEGWGETHPQAWWDAVVRAVHALDPDLRRAVRGLGCAGQMHGVVLCDAHGAALRPAILWLDTRSSAELALFPRDTAERTGNRPAAGMAGASLLWLKRHEPDRYASAVWMLQPKDWLRMRLGSPPATDPSESTATLLADRRGAWDYGLVEALGLRSDWLPPVHASDAVAGQLAKAAASELGLPAGLTLAVGAGDTAAAALGSGLLRHGDAQLTTGTGGQLVVMQATCPGTHAQLNSFRSANPEHYARWYVLAAMQNAGLALDWARGVLGMTWEQAYQGAASARGGRVVFLPYLSGERTPLMDANARGAWIGLGVGDDRASMMRAAFEGVAFGLRTGLDALEQAGFRVRALRFAGGGSAQAWWRQLLADVLMRGLACFECSAASARGAALLAGIAVGHWSGEALDELVPPTAETIEPHFRAELAARYERFRALYPLLKDWFNQEHVCAQPRRSRI